MNTIVHEHWITSLVTAALLKRMRKLGKLTQMKLAENLDVSQARISQLEAAQDVASLQTLIASAKSVGAQLTLRLEHPDLSKAIEVNLTSDSDGRSGKIQYSKKRETICRL